MLIILIIIKLILIKYKFFYKNKIVIWEYAQFI